MHRNVKLLGWFNFCMEFRLYGPFIAIYFSQVTGSYALGMSIFSVATLTGSLLEVPTGIFSDRVGRKKTIVFGAAAGVASVTFYAIGSAYWALAVGAMFEGLARAFFSGNNDALLYDTLAESSQQAEYQEYVGKASSMYQFALAAAALIGGVVAHFSLPAAVWLSVIPQVAGLLISLRFVEPSVHIRESANIYAHLRQAFQNMVRNPRLRTLSAGTIIGGALSEAGFQFRVVFIESLWPLWAIGIARMLANVGAALSFYNAGRLIKRFGELRLLTVGVSYSEMVNIFGLVVPTVLSPALMASTSMFYGVNMVSINGLMQREFTSEQRATMGSLNAFGVSIVFSIFALVLGWLADQIGVIPALVITEVGAFATLPLFWQAFRHPSAAVVSANQ